MDPQHLFVDERSTGFCVYCGSEPSTRDHVPSRVLIDEPYPADLPVVAACAACNASFSKDEQYVACLVECALTGSVEPDTIQREKIKRTLCDNPSLASRLAKSRQVNDSGGIFWKAEVNRVQNVVLKLARGHLAYEFSEPQLDEPENIAFAPFAVLSEDQKHAFESSQSSSLWPEMGSRAFLHVVQYWPGSLVDDWRIVQPRRYRYLIKQDDEIMVRMVLSEYLACEVAWL